MDCNLELGLLPFSSSNSLSSTSSTLSLGSNCEGSSKPEQMTIFYNGSICVCDVTEFQARSIISHASKKSAERMSRSCSTSKATTLGQQIRLNSDHTMKRSLQQFLEKRQHRIQATSPYYRH